MRGIYKHILMMGIVTGAAGFGLDAFAYLPTGIAVENGVQGNNPVVEKFTNYAPMAGGINGRCGKSASGYDACKFFLEDFLQGKAPAVMGAVPQKGGTSDLFGGIYLAKALQQKLGRPVKVFAGDRYGKGSDNKHKMDIVTRKSRSKEASLVNTAQGEMIPLGRAPNMRYPKRKIAPNVRAMEPVPLS